MVTTRRRHVELRVVALLAAATLASACDKVYHARFDVGPYAPGGEAAAALRAEERDRAVAAFHAASKDLELQCEPTPYPLISRSYDTARYSLVECRSERYYTTVQLALSAEHLSVEVHEVGGMSEPVGFRRCRTGLADALVRALGAERVHVRYPYRR